MNKGVDLHRLHLVKKSALLLRQTSGHEVPSLLDLLPRRHNDIEDARDRSLELVFSEAPGHILIGLGENGG